MSGTDVGDRRDEPARPLSAVFAFILLGLIAVSGVAYGILLVAIAELAFIGAPVVIAGVTCITFGVAAGYAAIGVWRGRAPGWWTGVLVAGIGLAAVVLAIATGSWESPLLIAVAQCGGAMALLLLPSTRRHAGV